MNSIQQIASNAWQGLAKQNIIESSTKLLETINQTALPILQSIGDSFYALQTSVCSMAAKATTFAYQASFTAAPYVGIVAAAALTVGLATYCLDAYGIIKLDTYGSSNTPRTEIPNDERSDAYGSSNTPRTEIPDDKRTDMPENKKIEARKLIEECKTLIDQDNQAKKASLTA